MMIRLFSFSLFGLVIGFSVAYAQVFFLSETKEEINIMDTDFFYSIDGNIRSEGEIFSDDKDISTQSESTKGEVLLKEDDVPLAEEMSARDLINRLSPLFEEGNNEIPTLEEINKTLKTLGIEISDDISIEEIISEFQPEINNFLENRGQNPTGPNIPIESLRQRLLRFGIEVPENASREELMRILRENAPAR
ncbi:MAG: hypothetical protein CL780_00740 [Chloroflexi bacterium]|nr:hypothetical protein [Chloroflexota bacterium]|tara:strand:- start:876 stop:1454 length:579 start_codon:yes stop_codon:yes gene_type:complete